MKSQLPRLQLKQNISQTVLVRPSEFSTKKKKEKEKKGKKNPRLCFERLAQNGRVILV